MSEDLIAGEGVALIGLLVVFAVLSLIAGLISLVRRIDDRWQAAERREEESAALQPPTIDATTLVILTAAVATVFHGRARIARVRRLLSADAPSSPWAVQGRMVLLGSHSAERGKTQR